MAAQAGAHPPDRRIPRFRRGQHNGAAKRRIVHALRTTIETARRPLDDADLFDIGQRFLILKHPGHRDAIDYGGRGKAANLETGQVGIARIHRIHVAHIAQRIGQRHRALIVEQRFRQHHNRLRNMFQRRLRARRRRDTRHAVADRFYGGRDLHLRQRLRHARHRFHGRFACNRRHRRYRRRIVGGHGRFQPAAGQQPFQRRARLVFALQAGAGIAGETGAVEQDLQFTLPGQAIERIGQGPGGHVEAGGTRLRRGGNGGQDEQNKSAEGFAHAHRFFSRKLKYRPCSGHSLYDERAPQKWTCRRTRGRFQRMVKRTCRADSTSAWTGNAACRVARNNCGSPMPKRPLTRSCATLASASSNSIAW